MHQYITTHKGRGAQINTSNKFTASYYTQSHAEAIDDVFETDKKTEVIFTYPKSIINKLESKDVGLEYSLNPYQGCEHGCTYCYARNSHEYWGYSAGIDFEQKILVKQNISELLEKQFKSKNYVVKPIMLSGNTDCYQPLEKKYELTKKVLQLCLKYKHPVGIITKNALVLRDLELLKELAQHDLVKVVISITGTDEHLRLKLEPRTSTYAQRFNTLSQLSKNRVPCGIMIAPIIPGINSFEIPKIMDLASKAGATSANYTIVRLNGAIGEIFKDWLTKNFPDRATKIWNQISEAHGGKVSDSRPGVRMRGEGKIAESIKQLFTISKTGYMKQEDNFKFNTSLFSSNIFNGQLNLF
ncbi:MAG: PA0069 family radical SAM protein [Bacteroidetes bacterium]|nr:PA0069 family radical SAM protein [Bacteroidota bacterium]